MRFSLTLLILAGVIGLAAGFAGGYLMGKAQKRTSFVEKKVPIAAPKESSHDLVLQDGKIVSLETLFSVYRANPNRFRAQTASSNFRIEGRIAKIGEASLLDKISGFHVPLKSSTDAVERTLDAMEGRVTFSRSVSLFVKSLTTSQIAALRPGETIKVNCSNVRIVMDGFVFDDCTLVKGPK